MIILSYVFYFTVAALCAYFAERIVPGVIPGGVLTSTLLGALGAYSGSNYLMRFGPDLYGISLLPGTLCAILVVFTVAFISKEFKRKRSA